MSADFLRERKKQRRLLFIFGGLILAILSVFLFNLVKKSQPAGEAVPAAVAKPEKIEINFHVLKNPILKELQPYIEPSPFSGEPGRDNPFSPYTIAPENTSE